MNTCRQPFFTASKIAKIAILAALSFGLYMFPKFPLPIFPVFLEINFSDIPALIGGFVLGPISGLIIVLIKVLLKLPFTHTVYVGEFADLLIGWAFVVPSAIIYKYNRTLKGALFSLFISALASTITAMLANRYILIPLYKELIGFDKIIGACAAVLPKINEQNFYSYYIFYAVLPFNLIRCIIAASLTFVLYKKTAKVLCKF